MDQLWALLEDWWPGFLEAAGLAGWQLLARDPLARRFWLLRGRLWALLEDWWLGILETAGLAAWVAGGQASTGQKVWVLLRPAVGPI